MPTHRFKIGSAVSLNADGRSSSKASRFIVEAQMPPVGSLLQYRIKSETEDFRRVVVEHQLTSFSSSPVLGPAPVPAPAARPHPGEEN